MATAISASYLIDFCGDTLQSKFLNHHLQTLMRYESENLMSLQLCDEQEWLEGP